MPSSDIPASTVQPPNDSPDQTAPIWKLRSQVLNLRRIPGVMGIVNVTPDSFSDGGQFQDASAAIDHAVQLAEQGAAILDIGGESTRPYSTPVDVEEEISRVIPVIEGILRQTQIPVSIDTSKSAVAQAAIDAGAEIINDVTGLEGDPKMLDVARRHSVGVCAMHMQGTPQTMQDRPHYDDVVSEIHTYLDQRKSLLIESGIDSERICLDPGIGFGKTHQHNIQLLAHCERFLDLGRPILIGHSRKGFVGKILGDKTVDRDAGTLAITLMLAQKGVQFVRVHEVESTVRALEVLLAVGGIDDSSTLLE